MSPRKLFLILAQIALDIRVRLHYANGVQWITLTSVHLFGWEVRAQVAQAEGKKSVIMGASLKGAGHYMLTSSTLPFPS